MTKERFNSLSKEKKDALIIDAFDMIVLDKTIRIDGMRVKPSTVVKRALFFDSSVLATIIAASLHVIGAKEIDRKNGILPCLQSNSTGLEILREIGQLKESRVIERKVTPDEVQYVPFGEGIRIQVNNELYMKFVHTCSLCCHIHMGSINKEDYATLTNTLQKRQRLEAIDLEY